MRICATLVLLIFIFSTAVPAQQLSEQKKLQTIQLQLEKSKQQLKKTKEEEQKVLSRLAVINKELSRTKGNLFLANKKIQSNRGQISVLTVELQQTEKDLAGQEAKLGSRISEVYKSSGLSYLQLLFASSSMSDFLNRLYFFRKILEYDANLVQDTREDFRKARRKKSLLLGKNREITSLAQEIAVKKNEIAAKAEEKNKIYKSLQQRSKEYEAQVAELEKSSEELEVLILKKIAARKGTKVHGSGRLDWPLQGRITSRFGWRRHPLWGGRNRHTGIDIAGKYGTPIRAADSGEVIFSGWWDGYGKAVVIDHGRNTTTVYGHLSRIYKKVGAVVAKGQTVGLVGSTGYSTGPHLHFEVRNNGKPVDPMTYLN